MYIECFWACFIIRVTGDPTVFNNLPIPEHINKCVVDKIHGQKHNGYNPSIGITYQYK